MAATCEIRQIIAEDADAYVREPALLIQAEQTKREIEQEAARKRRQTDPNSEWWEETVVDDRVRHYDWIVLVKGIVSFSKIAHSLVVHGGRPIGGLEESWQLEANAKVLDVEQVVTVYQELAPVSVTWANEDFSGQAEMFEDFQKFLKEATETGKALLIFVGP
jgi:hypothetical protein